VWMSSGDRVMAAPELSSVATSTMRDSPSSRTMSADSTPPIHLEVVHTPTAPRCATLCAHCRAAPRLDYAGGSGRGERQIAGWCRRGRVGLLRPSVGGVDSTCALLSARPLLVLSAKVRNGQKVKRLQLSPGDRDRIAFPRAQGRHRSRRRRHRPAVSSTCSRLRRKIAADGQAAGCAIPRRERSIRRD